MVGDERQDDGLIEISVDMQTAVICNQEGVDALERATELAEELAESYEWDTKVQQLHEDLVTVSQYIGYIHHFEDDEEL